MKKTILLLLATLSVSSAFADQTNLAVKKMTCLSCAKKVKTALMKLPGVEKVEVDTKTNVVAVTTKPKTATTTEQMISAVSGAGFPASLAP